MTIKVLGVVFSPRKQGNTEILMDEALAGARSEGAITEKICIRDFRIEPCDGCFSCAKTGECHIDDDMQKIYGKLLESNGIIFGSPVYWTVCGQGAIFLDRTIPLSLHAKLAGKVGGGIAVAASIAANNVLDVFRRYFMYNHMFCVDLVYGYAAKPGEIRKHELAMKCAFEMGRQVVLLAKKKPAFPEEFKKPLVRFVMEKYKVGRFPK